MDALGHVLLGYQSGAESGPCSLPSTVSAIHHLKMEPLQLRDCDQSKILESTVWRGI